MIEGRAVFWGGTTGSSSDSNRDVLPYDPELYQRMTGAI